MSDRRTFDEAARHYAFLTAAWVANVDGTEDGKEMDALCQLREALGIAPSAARRLLTVARSAAAFPPPGMEAV